MSRRKEKEPEGETRPVAAYIRVSTLRQGEEGGSEESQRRTLQIAASLYYPDAKVVEFSDRASGRNDLRPGYQDLMAGIRRRRFRALLAWDHDRLARNSATFAKIISEVESTGTDLYIHKLGVCSLTPAGKLVLAMLAACGEFESAQIGDRIKLAWKVRKEDGRRGPGHRPFGWDGGPSEILTHNKEEQALIRSILALRLQGVSWRQCAKVANDTGIRAVRGGKWTAQGLHTVVNSAAERLRSEDRRRDQGGFSEGAVAQVRPSAMQPVGTPAGRGAKKADGAAAPARQPSE